MAGNDEPQSVFFRLQKGLSLTSQDKLVVEQVMKRLGLMMVTKMILEEGLVPTPYTQDLLLSLDDRLSTKSHNELKHAAKCPDLKHWLKQDYFHYVWLPTYIENTLEIPGFAAKVIEDIENDSSPGVLTALQKAEERIKNASEINLHCAQ